MWVEDVYFQSPHIRNFQLYQLCISGNFHDYALPNVLWLAQNITVPSHFTTATPRPTNVSANANNAQVNTNNVPRNIPVTSTIANPYVPTTLYATVPAQRIYVTTNNVTLQNVTTVTSRHPLPVTAVPPLPVTQGLPLPVASAHPLPVTATSTITSNATNTVPATYRVFTNTPLATGNIVTSFSGRGSSVSVENVAEISADPRVRAASLRAYRPVSTALRTIHPYSFYNQQPTSTSVSGALTDVTSTVTNNATVVTPSTAVTVRSPVRNDADVTGVTAEVTNVTEADNAHGLFE